MSNLEHLPTRPAEARPAVKFLARLADPARPAIPAHNVALVVARPGDETLACGATLRRLKGARLIVVTDGAGPPLNAGSRWRELLSALALVGLKSSAAIGFGLKEEEAGKDIAALAGRFARQFFRDGTAIVLTRSGEGAEGRAILRALEAAVAHCARRGQEVAVIDMPRAGAATRECLVLSLDARDEALKRHMLACFAAPGLRQRSHAAEECFRFVHFGELASISAEPQAPARRQPRRRVLLEVELQVSA